MLVLSRRPGERILVGDDIVLTVVRIGPNSVRLGIDAPLGLNIRREEIERYDEFKPSQQNLSTPEAE